MRQEGNSILSSTILHLMIHNSLFDLAAYEIFARGKGNLNIVDSLGQTAMHLLFKIWSSSPTSISNLASFFLKSGADPNVRDCEGQTPLIVALLNRDLNAVSFASK
jgi:ankyrin repeat protein